MDYFKLVEYFNSVDQFGINPGLARIQALLKELGNPQDSLSIIHLTGTNGKTSTARIISSILAEHGLKAGNYTSPHLCSYTERFCVDGCFIPELKLVEVFEKNLPSLKKVEKEVYPDKFSLFEILTALAFQYFYEVKVDCVVLEVGMGGRWDATNVIKAPVVSVVTNVSLDHTDRLGETVTEIAWEKAHIIKKGSFAIAGNLVPEALKVVEERCLEEGVALKLLGRDFSLLERRRENSSQIISIKGLYGNYEGLKMHLLGEHQAVNATLATVSVEVFLKEKFSEEKLKTGLRKAKSPGRLEKIKDNPTIILDGAHNPHGAAALAQTLRSEFSYRNLILVISILNDKDIVGILRELMSLASLVIFTENQSYRSTPAHLLAKKAKSLGSCKIVVEPDLPNAIKEALRRAIPVDLICITGSLYAVGDAKLYFANKGLI